MKSRTRLLFIYGLILAGSIAWIFAIVAAPGLRSQSPQASRFLYLVFGPTCHQIPARCFQFNGYPLAVCARCFGIYTGFLIGTLSYPWIRGFNRIRLPSLSQFTIFTLPIVLDAGGNFLGLWSTPGGIRFALGISWGVLLPYYVITGAAELALLRRDLK